VLAAASAAGCPADVTRRSALTADELVGTPPEAGDGPDSREAACRRLGIEGVSLPEQRRLILEGYFLPVEHGLDEVAREINRELGYLSVLESRDRAGMTPAESVAAGGAALDRALAGTPGVAHVTPPVVSADGKAVMLIAYPTTQEQDPATNALVNHLTGQVLPQAEAGTGLTAYLTGPNAGNVTFANQITERLPWLIGIVIGLSMLLLLVVFRSIAVAIKAALMNLLSIAAAYGVLVAVTQWGWGHQLFGFSEPIPITTWVPMFLFVILFGLSMDYEVFLLSRIKENYDRTGDNTASVARGLAQTARVITAAAAIMVVVFASFVLGADVSVKQIGLGLAVAVLVDATVVRLVLVPAIMELLGRANWWLPGWLDRILPRSPEPEPELVSDGSAGVAGVAPVGVSRR